jgi:hypothetical protein
MDYHSVFLMSYNHSRYIEEAIQSICMQTMADKLEVIWHDDASTDETRAIGSRAFENFPGKLVKLFRKFNRIQRRVPFLLDLLEQCTGKYIFLLEGDDRWDDNGKCQSSIAALDAHPQHNLLFTAANIIDERSNASGKKLGDHGPAPGVLDSFNAIALDGGAMPTCTACLRTSHFESAPFFVFEFPALDFGIQMYCSYPSGAIYLPQTTASWRSQSEGNHTSRILSDRHARMGFEKDLTELLRKAREYFPHQYSSAIDKVYLLHLNRLILQGVYTPHGLRPDVYL